MQQQAGTLQVAQEQGTQASAIGAVHLAGTRDGRYTHDTWVFLQGFCVLRPAWSSREEVNVVHLDPRQFMARLPDRDTLIDADEQLRRVEAQVKQAWRTVLEVARTQLGAAAFVDTYFDAMKQWGHLDLLNDMDVLPAALFERIVGYPIQAAYGQRDYVEPLEVAPSRQDIEEGRVTIVSLGWPGGDNVGHWMLAKHKQWLTAEAHILDPGHWLRPHVRYIEDQDAQIEVQSETARATLEGRWVWPLVIVCQSVRIRVGDHAVVIVDEGVCHDGDILVPAGETTGEPLDDLNPLRTFVAVAERTGALYREFLRRDAWAAGIAALPSIARAPRRTWETFRYGTGADELAGLPDAEILSVAVAPAARGRGVGRALVAAATEELTRRGVDGVRVVTAEGNAPALAMYEAAGFARRATTEVHAGVRQVVLAWP